MTRKFISVEKWASHREIEHIRKVRTLEKLELKQYRVLLPLSNVESVIGLTHIAVAIAKKSKAEILFLHVDEVREKSPLVAEISDHVRIKPLFDPANEVAANENVAARSILNVSYRISQGIVNTAEEQECNFILVGRRKHPDFFERFFSSIIESVIRKFPGEVAVLHGILERQNINLYN